MPKCDSNKVALQLYRNHTSAWVFSCKFATYFQNTFPYEHLWIATSDCWKDIAIWSDFVIVNFNKFHTLF